MEETPLHSRRGEGVALSPRARGQNAEIQLTSLRWEGALLPCPEEALGSLVIRVTQVGSTRIALLTELTLDLQLLSAICILNRLTTC